MPHPAPTHALALATLVLAGACGDIESPLLTGTGDTTAGDTTAGDTDPTGGAENEPPGEEAGSDKPRNLAPDATADELATMARDERDFAVTLFNALPASASNRAIAPLSLRIPFGMVYEGARTVSEGEIRDVLRFTLDRPRLHAAFNEIDLELAQRDLPPSGEVDGDDSVQLSLVHQMFGRIGVEWAPAFLDVLAVNYGSGLRMLDIAGDPEAARLAMNAWVAGETFGKLDELLPPDAIEKSVTGVLINATYLKAPWAHPFAAVLEGEGFLREDGVAVEVAMMDGDLANAGYFKGDGVEAVELPLRGEALTMVVIVPDAGTFGAYVGGLDGAALGDVFAGLDARAVHVTLPRFRFATDLALRTTLGSLGMQLSFDLLGADFTGLTTDAHPMSLAGVYHDTFVAVDEKGVEAAAASAVVLEDTDVVEAPEVSLRADRPFLFAIRDRSTDALLFFGRVLDPSAM